MSEAYFVFQNLGKEQWKVIETDTIFCSFVNIGISWKVFPTKLTNFFKKKKYLWQWITWLTNRIDMKIWVFDIIIMTKKAFYLFMKTLEELLLIKRVYNFQWWRGLFLFLQCSIFFWTYYCWIRIYSRLSYSRQLKNILYHPK